jgi:alkanesulfonate monooxygenase SsuD/methylene tetrahydromethanopterin reductase-like flavin-dependent oxidoreductase (luciferase family)
MVNVGFYMKADASAAASQRTQFFTEWGSMAETLQHGMLFCTPREAIDRIAQYVEAGAARVVLNLLQSPLDWDALQAFVEDVMPAFR